MALLEKKNALKKLLPTFAVVFLFFVLALINTYVLKPERGEEVTQGPPEVAFLDLDPRKIDGIRITDHGKTVLLRKKRNQWQVKKTRWLPANEDLISSLLEYADRWNALRSLGEVEKLKDFQLDKDRKSIAFLSGKKELAKVLVGAKNAAEDGYFVRKALGNRVFLLASYKVDEFFKEPDDFRETEVLKFDQEKARELHIKHKGKHFQYVRRKKKWEMKLPFRKRSTKLHDEVDLMLTTLSSLTSMEFGPDNPKNLKPFGLDPPVTEFEVVLKDGRKKLLIGKEKEHNLYARKADDRAIYIVGGFVNERLKELLNQSKKEKKEEPEKQKT